MPKASVIEETHIEEFRRRRLAGEEWKAIARDMAARGLPSDRSSWWRALRRDVAQRREDCGAAA